MTCIHVFSVAAYGCCRWCRQAGGGPRRTVIPLLQPHTSATQLQLPTHTYIEQWCIPTCCRQSASLLSRSSKIIRSPPAAKVLLQHKPLIEFEAAPVSDRGINLQMVPRNLHSRRPSLHHLVHSPRKNCHHHLGTKG